MAAMMVASAAAISYCPMFLVLAPMFPCCLIHFESVWFQCSNKAILHAANQLRNMLKNIQSRAVLIFCMHLPFNVYTIFEEFWFGIFFPRLQNKSNGKYRTMQLFEIWTFSVHITCIWKILERPKITISCALGCILLHFSGLVWFGLISFFLLCFPFSFSFRLLFSVAVSFVWLVGFIS